MSTASDRSTDRGRRAAARTLKILAILVAAVVLLVALTSWFALRTERGARFVLDQAVKQLDGKLSYGAARGVLPGMLELDDLRYRDPAAGIDLRIPKARVDIAARQLLSKTVRIESFEADGLTLALTTVPEQPDDPNADPWQPPVPIIVERALLTNAHVTQDGKPIVDARRFELAGAWTSRGVDVSKLVLDAEQGRANLVANVSSAEGHAGKVRGDVLWHVGERNVGGAVALDNDGRRARLDAKLTQPLTANALVEFTPRGEWPWQGRIDVPRFDVAQVLPDSTLGEVVLSLAGSGDRQSAALTGEVELKQRRVRIDEARLALANDVLTLAPLRATLLDGSGSAEARGTVDLAAEPASAQLDVSWADVVLPAELEGEAIESRGALRFAGSAEKYDAEGKLTVGPAGEPTDLDVKLAGEGDAIRFERLDVVQPKGRLAATGTVTLGPALAWDFEARGENFDPGPFAAGWPGSLTFVLDTDGTQTADGPRGDVVLTELSGTLRDKPVSGGANFHIEPGYRFEGRADLRSGVSKLSVVGRAGDATDVSATFDVGALTDFVPETTGSLRGEFTARGTWPQLAVRGQAEGRSLSFAGHRAGTLDVRADVSSFDPPAGRIDVTGTRIVTSGFEFDTLTMLADGDRGAHRLTLDAVGERLTVATELQGGATALENGGDRWSGTLRKLDLRFGELPTFNLNAPSQIVADAETFSISDSCLEADGATVCVAADRVATGTELRYRVDDVPIATVVAFAAADAPVAAQGMIDGRGTLRREPDGTWTGTANLTSPEGSVAYPDTSEEPLLAYTGFTVDAELARARSSATVRASLNDGGTLSGRLAMTPSGDTQALDGEIALALGSLRFIELLTPEVAKPRGKLAGRYAIGGTLAQPRLTGELTLSEFAAEIPVAGLELTNGQVRLSAVGDAGYELTGRVTSGEGTLQLLGKGGVVEGAPFEVTVRGQNVLAADIAGARVTATPDLKIGRTRDGLKIRGDLAIPSADIDLKKLPGGGSPRASDDVVVVDADATEEEAAMPLNVDVMVTLGEDVDIVGYGLNGEVEGELRIRERPGRTATGTGQIRVTGRYKAYGQDLQIERGRLLFASSALDDPGLDIRAYRKLKDVKPGLRIQGTAKSPVLTVFAEPAMEQAQALSYLVTGRPLQSLSNSDTKTVDVARRALQTATGDLLAKSIGKKLGVDEIGVDENEALGGTAFTVGKYLSPRLYLSYGMGVFDPGQVVTLKYQLTKKWEIEASSGTVESRAGVNYKIERD